MNAFGSRDTVYIRQKHDTAWHGWYKMQYGDSGWLTLTNSSVFNGSIYYRKVSNIVFVSLPDITLKAARDGTGWTALATLPAGYRPGVLGTANSVIARNNSNVGVLYVSSDGQIKLSAYGSATIGTTFTLYTCIAFPV